MCDDIKIVFELDDWRPESLARSARVRAKTDSLSHHEADHGELDDGEMRVSDILDIVGQPVAGAKSSEFPRDEPALRAHDEPLAFDDLEP